MSLHAAVFNKLAEKFGGVAELSAFGKHEQRRLAEIAKPIGRGIRSLGIAGEKRDPAVRIARFSSFGPLMVEITAAGWVRANAAAVRP